jgi:pantoate--beta-alanine ligase
VEIIGAPTIRDEAGLAMSSRNAYLSATELGVARQLNRIMHDAAAALAACEPEAETLRKAITAILVAGFDRVDYLAARESDTLMPWRRGKPGRILAAAWLGQTRLIDNLDIPTG